MENNISPELIEQARAAKSAEEMIALAKENGMELTAEAAQAYYNQFHGSGALNDEELGNVSGGGCYTGDNRLIVSPMYSCSSWMCKDCGSRRSPHVCFESPSAGGRRSFNNTAAAICSNCHYLSVEGGLDICNKP